MLAQQIILDTENQIKFNTSMLFQHACGHYEIFRTLIWGSSMELLIKDGHAALSRKIEARLTFLLTTQKSSSIPLPVLANAVAGVLLVLLKWWLDNKMPYTPERMDEIFQQLMMHGMQAALS
jgi:hypothetical protein